MQPIFELKNEEKTQKMWKKFHETECHEEKTKSLSTNIIKYSIYTDREEEKKLEPQEFHWKCIIISFEV